MPSNHDLMEIARLIRIAGNIFRSRKEHDATDVGLTIAQAEALQYIYKTNNPRIGDIAITMGITHQAACGIVDRMSSKGLVETLPSPKDGRVKTVKMTLEGQAAYDKFISLGMKTVDGLLGDLNEEELLELRELLIRICKKY